ncbi:MAG: WD40 repeat domain-containing protein [Gemmataceae bacterium]
MKHLCTIVALVAALGSPAWGVETEENLPREAVARLGTLRYRHCNPILDLSLDPTGKMIATAGFLDDRVCLWDRISGRKLHELKVSFVKWVEFARDGSFLMVGTPEVEPKFRFFDTRTGRRLDKIDPTAVPPRALAETVQFNEPDVFLRDVNGKVLAKFNAPGEKLRFQFAAVASDGRTLAVSGRKGQSGCVWLWDIPSGKRLAVIETTGVGVVSNLRFSADG